ncbi:MAG TPA: S8 family peptidase [Clostridiaceae bacterium]
MAKSSGLLNLLINAPTGIKEKLAKFSQNDEILKGKVELVVLYGDGVAEVNNKISKLGGTLEDLGFGFGIITIDVSLLNQVSAIPEIQYIELPKTLFTSYLPANDASCITPVWETDGLTGEGVVIGFIDSGIDYLHPAFIDEAGNTRIDSIYDLSVGSRVYDSAQINLAIKSPDPISIVPETDDLGHGTHVAGIACGGGKIDKLYYGAAFKSRIIMVKMTGSGKVNYAKSTQLMRGIKLLIDWSRRNLKPLVINLSFSTNDGAHDGESLLEQYIRTISGLERLTFVCASGNEGDSGHHVGGVFSQDQSITVNVGGNESNLVLQLYKNILDDISIKIKTPDGKTTDIIKIKEGFTQGTVGDNNYYIYNSGPKPFSIDGEIVISLNALKDTLTEGPWVLEISLTQPGKPFDIWMPVSEGLSKDTRFLEPNPLNTVGIPGTVYDIITVGSYNHNTDSISSFSGRGGRDRNPLKPDLVAPGEDIQSSMPGGFFGPMSGTSMATPVVSGAAALLMEWGYVKGNDPLMYGSRLKYFLLKSAIRNRVGVIYPDPEWGYGKLCLKEGLNLAKNIYRAGNALRQTGSNLSCGELYIKEDYENFVVEYQGDIVGAFKKIGGACAFIVDGNYAIVSIQASKAQTLLTTVPEIVYFQDPIIYTLTALSPIQTSNIYKFHTSPYLTLTGQGVIVGLIDTGIDYLNVEFMKEDNTTRIKRMWDQTGTGGKVPPTYNFGVEYDETQINEAIKAKANNQDPYAIVAEKDEIGHGTEIAGIIGGRGINPDLVGAAPGCDFIVCKLKQARKSNLEAQGIYDPGVPTYSNTDLILAIQYVVRVAEELKRPIVIHIPLGTNRGPHDGNTPLEKYIDELSRDRGLAIVTNTGNEGDTETHAAGVIKKEGDIADIELKVDDTQRDIMFSIWTHKPDQMSLGVVSPTGEVIDKIPSKLKQTQEIKFITEGSSLSVTYFIPDELTGDENIQIMIRNIKGGIWKFRLYGDYVVDGRYDAWLPQRALIKENTRFISPNVNVTLTSPSSGRDIITVASYNQDNGTILSSSGRGYTRDNRVKPDIAAGGVNVTTTKVGGGATTVTGGSAASAVMAGASALLFEWGIVKGNDPTLFSTNLKTYLIRGTSKRPGDEYPNPEWGYGSFDLEAVFQNSRGYAFEADSQKSIIAFINQAEEDGNYLI